MSVNAFGNRSILTGVLGHNISTVVVDGEGKRTALVLEPEEVERFIRALGKNLQTVRHRRGQTEARRCTVCSREDVTGTWPRCAICRSRLCPECEAAHG